MKFSRADGCFDGYRAMARHGWSVGHREKHSLGSGHGCRLGDETCHMTWLRRPTRGHRQAPSIHEACKGQGRPCLASLLNRTTEQWRRSKRPQQMPEGGDGCHAGRDSSLRGEEDLGSRRAVWSDSSSRKAGPTPRPPPPHTPSFLPANFRPPSPQAKGTCPPVPVTTVACHPPTPCKFQQFVVDTCTIVSSWKTPPCPTTQMSTVL